MLEGAAPADIQRAVDAVRRGEVLLGPDLSNVFTKLQVADRAQAIVRAREAGLGLGS